MAAYDLFNSEQIRKCEQFALSHLNIPANHLMQLAGSAAFNLIKKLFPHVQKVIIYCGSGNNAGDGYALATRLHKSGYSVIINQYKAPEDLPLCARNAAEEALKAGVACHWMEDESAIIEADLIVDALIGIGLKEAVREFTATAICQINDSNIPVLSLDIPSGLHVDTGNCLGIAVRATATITFIGKKIGMYTLDGPEYCGEIHCDDLGLSQYLNQLDPAARLLVEEATLSKLPYRPRNCHKGDFGHVLIIGGDKGMSGSVRLAALAALRVGAGQVTIATCPEYAYTNVHDGLEIMMYAISKSDELIPLIKRATVCVIGPGLGLNGWGKQLFKKAIASQLPMVVDASALRILAENPQYDDNWILTPHPGEAGCLLNCSSHDVQVDRFKAITALQKQYGGNIVLKGAGSLVQTDTQTFICNAGNPGMATAGMGDILSGVIAGLISQKLSLSDAAKLGVWLHARAGDEAAYAEGQVGIIASDLFPFLRILANKNIEKFKKND